MRILYLFILIWVTLFMRILYLFILIWVILFMRILFYYELYYLWEYYFIMMVIKFIMRIINLLFYHKYLLLFYHQIMLVWTSPIFEEN